jgi:spermidine synthase
VSAAYEPEPRSLLDWHTVETTRVGDSLFVLARHGDDWVVRVDQRILMTNRMHDSEIALAEHAISRCEDPVTVLVGGLGLGYTLRAVLDLVGDDAQVTVAELVPALVDWNRRILGTLNDHPLRDPRTSVVVGDVFDLIKQSPARYDVIVLDVDNGPQALAQAKNQRLYGDSGVRACLAALRPGGVLGVWSNGPNAKYARRLEREGWYVEVLWVDACRGSRAQHVVFLAS